MKDDEEDEDEELVVVLLWWVDCEIRHRNCRWIWRVGAFGSVKLLLNHEILFDSFCRFGG